jgi:hypothetical protein
MDTRKTALILGAAGCLAAIAVAAAAQPKGPLAYAPDGKLIAPADYREWVFLSAGLDMTYGPAMPPPGVHRFDNVFVDPAAYQAFRRTGAWPDKTVMVLEVRNAAQDVSINKAGHVQTDVAAIELHVKDQAKGGWAFYGVDAKGETRKIPANSACDACHGSSGAVDTTFVQFYPTLIEAAKKAGTLKSAAN